MDTDYDYFTGVDPLIDVAARVNAVADDDFDDLYAAHKADYKELFDRVKLNLINTSFPADKTTLQLLTGYVNGNTAEEDRYLETLYYQFGRYLLISSSRPGSLPANLQGVWAEGLSPPWAADYHTNINVQMNYWPAEQANLSETAEPLIEYTKSLVPRGEFGAKRVFGEDTRGWTIWHENNIWGNTAPAVSGAFFSPEDGSWLAQHVWEHYAFTMDKDFLQDNYDLLLGSALFWVDNLVTDERDGTLVVSPSYSPEHGPYSIGATEAQAVVWGIFDEVIKASDVLGIDTPEVAEIKDSQSKLSGYNIGLGGQFQEWKDEINIDITGDGGHRHTNHLFPLHPGNQIVAGRSAEEDAYVEAMKKTLNTRGDGATGWSKGWKINFWARVREGDRSWKLVKEILTPLNRGGSTLNNLFDTHTPFQIDGNFGATSGITEMLLQSQGGAVELLPSLPSAWGTGEVDGLLARGNVEVDIAWEDKFLTSADLTAKVGGDLLVKYPNIQSATVTSDGEAVAFETVDANTIKIASTVGATYNISGVEELQVERDPYAGIEAVSADSVIGSNLIRGNSALENASSGDYAVYDNVNFGDDGAVEVAAELASEAATPAQIGTLEFRLDDSDAEPFAVLRGQNTGTLTTFKTLFTTTGETITGVHDLYVTFKGRINLKTIKFSETATDSQPTAINLLGDALVSIPTTEPLSLAYIAGVDYENGLTDPDSKKVTWSLGGDFQGVKLSDDGILTIKPMAVRQDVIITATSKEDPSVFASLPVELVNGAVSHRNIRMHDRNAEGPGSSNGSMTWNNSSMVEHTANNGWLKFNNINLNYGLLSATLTYSTPSDNNNRLIQIRVAEPGTTTSPTAPGAVRVATLDARASTGGWTPEFLKPTSTDEITDLDAAKGLKDVYLYWPVADLNAGVLTLDIFAQREEEPEQNEITFDVTPDDADVVVSDAEGYLYRASDGTVNVPEGEYAYAVSKAGYYTIEGVFTTSEAEPITVALVDKVQTLANLQALYDEGLALLDEDVYTTGTYDALEAAVEAAEAVLDNGADASYEEASEAIEALSGALDGLTLHMTSGHLAILNVAIANADKFVESDYSAEIWAPFASAVAAAKAIAQTPNAYTGDQATAAAHAVVAAEEALVRSVNKVSLNAFIAVAEGIMAESDTYLPVSITNLQEALNAAKTVSANAAATQTQVNVALTALQKAL
jgi:alpha-L-fucosidase 2